MKHFIDDKIIEETVVVQKKVKEYNLVLSKRELQFITVALGRMGHDEFADSLKKSPDIYCEIEPITEKDENNCLFALWSPLVKLIKE